jgi:hypothetical protein
VTVLTRMDPTSYDHRSYRAVREDGVITAELYLDTATFDALGAPNRVQVAVTAAEEADVDGRRLT